MKINEGRGISDINKIETERLFNVFKASGYTTFNYEILGKNINVTFDVGNYDSKYYKAKNINFFLFNIPKKHDNTKVKTIITHEINHFIEIINLENKKYRYPNYNKIKKALLEFQPNDKLTEFFKHLIYKTLDNDINANIAQTYTYLKSFDSDDEKFLLDKLDEYYLRKDYQNIIKINVKKFEDDLKYANIDLEELNRILIKYDVDSFLFFVGNYDNDYVKKWFDIIKSNAKKFLNKQDKIIKEVIEDLNYSSHNPTNENIITEFNNYVRYQIREIKLKNILDK